MAGEAAAMDIPLRPGILLVAERNRRVLCKG